MEKYLKIEATEVAAAMRNDPEFGMDVLAHFADNLETGYFAEQGAASPFHEAAAPVLSELAVDIMQALNDNA